MEQQPIRVQMPDGKVAEFPAGMTSEQIEQAIKTASAKEPFNAPRVVQRPYNAKAEGEGGKMTPEQIAKSKQFGMSLLPMAGAIGATVLTGGVGLPAVLAAAGGAGAGQAVKDTQWDMPVSERVKNVAKSATGAAVSQGIGEVVSAAAPHVAATARNMWQGAAKVPKSVAKTTQTALRGGSLPEAADEIAETVLSQGTGTIGTKNLDSMRSGLDALDDMVDSIIAKSTKFVSRSEIEAALLDKAQEIGFGTIAQAKEQAAIDLAFDQLQKLPPRMTVQKAQEVKRSIYQARKYVADAKDAAEAMADKTMGKAYRRAIAREEPAVRPLNDQLSRQIPATKAMEEAVTRTGRHSAVGLSQMLAGVVTNPLTVASALLNHPKVASFTAQRIYDVAKMLPNANRTVPNILRALQLLGKGEQ